MKKLRNEVVRTIEDKAFRIPETDSEGQPMMENEKPRMKEARLLDLLRILVFSLPADKITMQDSIHAHRLFAQLGQANDGMIPVEEAEHDWLKKRTEDFGPRVFGVNAVMLKEALENFERKKEATDAEK